MFCPLYCLVDCTILNQFSATIHQPAYKVKQVRKFMCFNDMIHDMHPLEFLPKQDSNSASLAAYHFTPEADQKACCGLDTSSARRQKGLTGYCFKYIDRPFCLQANDLH